MKSIKRQHDIYISNETNNDYSKVVIKGNKLNYRWFGKGLMIWTENGDTSYLPKKILELIEEIKKNDYN